MRAIFIGFAVLLCPGYCLAQQSIAPSVNNLVGLDMTLSNVVMSASVGEPAITTLNSPGGYLTQGLLQPEILPCTNVEFRYYPNPAQDVITIEAFGCEIRIQSMDVIDLWGRTILSAPAVRNNQLNMGDISPGMYFIKVKLTSGKFYTINIVKISN